MVCINKYDLNPVQTQAIENSAKKRKMRVLGRIPFDPIFVESMIQGHTVFKFKKDSAAKPAIAQIWENIMSSSEMGGI
jgi:MinD superfamily P-loop ATPase